MGDHDASAIAFLTRSSVELTEAWVLPEEVSTGEENPDQRGEDTHGQVHPRGDCFSCLRVKGTPPPTGRFVLRPACPTLPEYDHHDTEDCRRRSKQELHNLTNFETSITIS
jgi:hypothetical protein